MDIDDVSMSIVKQLEYGRDQEFGSQGQQALVSIRASIGI